MAAKTEIVSNHSLRLVIYQRLTKTGKMIIPLRYVVGSASRRETVSSSFKTRAPFGKPILHISTEIRISSDKVTSW
jgi:hypothetical protein